MLKSEPSVPQNGTVFGDMAFKLVNKLRFKPLKWVLIQSGVPIEDIWTRRATPGHACAGDGHGRTCWVGGHLQVKERVLRMKPWTPIPWPCAFSLQAENMNLCRWSHPVHGIWLWQAQETNASPISRPSVKSTLLSKCARETYRLHLSIVFTLPGEAGAVRKSGEEMEGNEDMSP